MAAKRPSGGAGRLVRLLALVPYVEARRSVSVAEAADAFGVSERQLIEDLNLLWCTELHAPEPYCPIDLSYEGGEIVVSDSGATARPLRLAVDEASALLVALRMLSELPGAQERAALDRVTAKLERAAGDAAAVSGRVAVHVENEPAALGKAREALDGGRAAWLHYYVPARDETTERTIDPMRLIVADGRSYLEAWCRRAEAVRLFRLDRVVKIVVLQEAAAPPREAQPLDVDSGLFRASPSDVRVTLEVTSQGRWVKEAYPCEAVEELADGGLRLVLATPDPRWIRRLALRLGEACRIVDPPELAARAVAEARSALALYEAVPASTVES